MCAPVLLTEPFALVLIDDESNQEFPGGNFDNGDLAIEVRDRLNRQRKKGEPRYVVRDESGDLFEYA